MRVIGADGTQIGLMLLTQALIKARELDLDLVEISPKATPVVCKVMDYNKHVYQTQKKTRKSSQNQQVTKELRLKPHIGDHDLQTKVKSGRKFLEEGHRLQVTMVFKGRELAHRDIGRVVIERFVKEIGPAAAIERDVHSEGRNMVVVLSPSKAGAS